MLWAWDRVIGERDRIEHVERAEAQSRAPRDENAAAPPDGTCRVCDYEGPERFCPRCLADTMVATPR